MLGSGSDQDIVIAGSTIYDNNAVAMQTIESYWSVNGNDAGDAIELGSACHWLFWRMVVAGGADALVTGSANLKQFEGSSFVFGFRQSLQSVAAKGEGLLPRGPIAPASPTLT